MGKFVKGQSGNPSGRPPGVPNKTTAEVKDAVQRVIERELEGLPKLLDSMEAKDRADVLIRLCGFVLPKITAGYNEVSIYQPVDGDALLMKLKRMAGEVEG